MKLLVMVMIACPVIMNIVQLWIQDQFLSAKARPALQEPFLSMRVTNTELQQNTSAAYPRQPQDQASHRGHLPRAAAAGARHQDRTASASCAQLSSAAEAVPAVLLLLDGHHGVSWYSIYFVYVIQYEQCYYDPCYAHRVGSPTHPLNLPETTKLKHDYARAYVYSKDLRPRRSSSQGSQC